MLLMTKFMRVVKQTAMTPELSISGGKPMRTLKTEEIVEVLDGPVKEEVSGVMRVSVRAKQDGSEGWVTVAGNAGTVFLADGGRTFKVVKPAVLTDSFELDAEEESTEDDDQKLKEGDVVDVETWAQKDPKSNCMRMKVRVQGSDGPFLWVTSKSNKGVFFLKAE